MNDSKAISTPMGTNGNLDSDASENMVDQKLYRSMIGSLSLDQTELNIFGKYSSLNQV